MKSIVHDSDLSSQNVGAIPFLPNATRLMSEFLHDLIEDSAVDLVTRAVRQAGVDSES